MEQQQADSGELVAALKDVSTQLRSVRDTFTSAHFEPVVNALNDVKGVLGNIENHMNNVENHMENVQKHMRNTKDDVADLRKEFVGTRAKMNHDAAMKHNDMAYAHNSNVYSQKELDKLLSRFDLPKDGSVKDKKCMLLNKIGCNLSFEDITNARDHNIRAVGQNWGIPQHSGAAALTPLVNPSTAGTIINFPATPRHAQDIQEPELTHLLAIFGANSPGSFGNRQTLLFQLIGLRYTYYY